MLRDILSHSCQFSWHRLETPKGELILPSITHSKLIARLVPGWHVGCRRSTPRTKYPEPLTENNVRAVFGMIAKTYAKGLELESGERIEMHLCHRIQH